MHSLISFIIVLGLLIFVHELGHFLFAKIFKVRVLKFALGFGPKLIGWQRGDTEYKVCAFPLGGYVKMYGDNPEEEIAANEAGYAFTRKPLWQRFIIVAGGPVFNLIFAVFLFALVFGIAGIPHPMPGTEIGQVAPDSPAEAAGLQSGDIILEINGQQTKEWENISLLIRDSQGKPITIVVRRGDERLTFTGQPTQQEVKNIFGEVVDKRLLLGITRTSEMFYEPIGPVTALITGFTQTWNFIHLTVVGIIKIFQQVVPATELGGPILIAQLAGQQMEVGWLNLVYFMAIISINLGILNLLPIPILDGGHLVFYTVEAIRRKPMSAQTQGICQQIGLVLLLSLMLFVFYNDLVRVFTN